MIQRFLGRSEKPNFVLQSSILPTQRKSYAQENRWLKPTPLVLKYTGPHKIDSGQVSVFVARETLDGTGVEVLEDQSCLVGEKKQAMTHSERPEILFQLKITTTSNSSKFFLMFVVDYSYEGVIVRETILSNPFCVESNIVRADAKEPQRPVVKSVTLLHASSTFVVHGKRFATDAACVRVQVGSLLAIVKNATRHSLQCELDVHLIRQQEEHGPLVLVGNVKSDGSVLWCNETVPYPFPKTAPIVSVSIHGKVQPFRRPHTRALVAADDEGSSPPLSVDDMNHLSTTVNCHALDQPFCFMEDGKQLHYAQKLCQLSSPSTMAQQDFVQMDPSLEPSQRQELRQRDLSTVTETPDAAKFADAPFSRIDILNLATERELADLCDIVQTDSTPLDSLTSVVSGSNSPVVHGFLSPLSSTSASSPPLTPAISKHRHERTLRKVGRRRQTSPEQPTPETPISHKAGEKDAKVAKRELPVETLSMTKGERLIYTAVMNRNCDLVASLAATETPDSLARCLGVITPSGDNLLMIACCNGDAATVKLLLDLGMRAETCNAFGETALHCAAACGNVECVLQLLVSGATIDRQTKAGLTALHVAVWNRHSDAVESLLTKSASVNVATTNGQTPLHLACLPNDVTHSHAELKILQTLIKHNADIRARDRIVGALPAHYAAMSASMDTLAFLLGVYSDAEHMHGSTSSISGLDNNDWTLLHYAAWAGNAEAIRFLLAPTWKWPHISSSTPARHTGFTELHLAVMSNSLPAVRAFLESGHCSAPLTVLCEDPAPAASCGSFSFETRDLSGHVPADYAKTPEMCMLITGSSETQPCISTTQF